MEKPNQLRLTIAWFVMAGLICGAAVWQMQVQVARDKQSKHRPLTPPAKTKHAIRQPTPFTGDPFEDYIARFQKGLTDQEVRWIVEDFQAAGLDQKLTDKSSISDAIQLRVAQTRWYHDLLVDTLRLSPEQSKEAKEKLQSLLRDEIAGHVSKLNEFSAPAWIEKSMRDYQPDWDDRRTDGALMPWNLCQLTPSQTELTGKPALESKGEEDWRISPCKLDEPLLSTVKRLNSAQLKTQLFFRPEMAATLQQELGAVGK